MGWGEWDDRWFDVLGREVVGPAAAVARLTKSTESAHRPPPPPFVVVLALVNRSENEDVPMVDF